MRRGKGVEGRKVGQGETRPTKKKRASRSFAMSPSLRLILFTSLLSGLLLLVVLFAGGWMRFGVTATFSFIIYVMAGLLSAVVCFGLLSSLGEVEGRRFGFALRLGGPIVALVLVAAGGGLYEKYLRTPESFSLRVNFYEDYRGQLAELDGEVSLFLGAEKKTEKLRSQGSIVFQGIGIQWRETPLEIALDSPTHQIELEQVGSFKLSGEEPVWIQVVWQRAYADPQNAELRLEFDGGSIVDLLPKPDYKNVTLHLRVFSQADLPIPLAESASVKILGSSGEAVFEDEWELIGPPTVPPRRLAEFSVDGLIPKDDLPILHRGSIASVTLSYDSLVGEGSREYQMHFDFNEETVPPW